VAEGNNDIFDHPRMSRSHVVEEAGWRIGLVHSIRPASRSVAEILVDQLAGQQVDVLVSGDTHLEKLEVRDGVLLANPGSPTLPHHKEYRLGTVGLLELSADALRAEIVVLGHSGGSPNPGVAQQIRLSRDGAIIEQT
jgi:putative phosphoesterase